MNRSIHEAVREACLWLPEAAEVVTHGFPSFKVRGKTFASYVVNHHGDGRVALWLDVPIGAQEHYVRLDPERFFVPPYVGPRGWLGVDVKRRTAWKSVPSLIREAYEKVAPRALVAALGKTPSIAGPSNSLSASDIDPMRSTQGAALLKLMRRLCLALPEAREVLQFGSPVWQAGKKTFAWARCVELRFALYCWVGVDRQGLMTTDSRYTVPAYLGHKGWIALDVSDHRDAVEIETLTLESYRHFALKRMLLRL